MHRLLSSGMCYYLFVANSLSMVSCFYRISLLLYFVESNLFLLDLETFFFTTQVIWNYGNYLNRRLPQIGIYSNMNMPDIYLGPVVVPKWPSFDDIQNWVILTCVRVISSQCAEENSTKRSKDKKLLYTRLSGISVVTVMEFHTASIEIQYRFIF